MWVGGKRCGVNAKGKISNLKIVHGGEKNCEFI